MHHLSINLSDKFNLSFFESVMFGGTDAMGNTRFEVSYMNPMIFYRFVEQQTGSADNAFLGVSFNWIIRKNLNLYGALLLDEFKIKEVSSGNGWGGNKQALQGGFRYTNVLGVKISICKGS